MSLNIPPDNVNNVITLFDCSAVNHDLVQYLSSFDLKGVIAISSDDFTLSRIAVISAWYCGWGVAVIPENCLEKHRLKMLKDADVSIYVCLKKEEVSLPVGVEAYFLKEEKEVVKEKTKTPRSRPHVWSKESVAAILFTSGSTGDPKGVCHSIHSLVSSAERYIRQFGIKSIDKLLCMPQLHTASGFRIGVMIPLMNDCHVYRYVLPPNLTTMLNVLEDERSTVLMIGPSFVQQVALLSRKLKHLGEHLRIIQSAGAKLNRSSRTQIMENIGVPVLDFYGLTETGGLVISESEAGYNPSSEGFGHACAGIDVSVRDRNGIIRHEGEGELIIFSDALYLGYLGGELKIRKQFETGDYVEIKEDGSVIWKYRTARGYKSESTEWVYPDLIESWLKKNTELEDVHVFYKEDKHSRPRFVVIVKGIAEECWEHWVSMANNGVVGALGSAYDMMCWEKCDKLERTGLGKIKLINE